MKKVKQYKNFTIKEVTEHDDKNIFDYQFYVYNKDMEIEFNCDSLNECIENIDSY